MNKTIYCGPFKTDIQEFIELKQSVGYKYLTEAGNLKRFDTFTIQNYPTATSLTKEIVMQWCTKKSYEKQENLGSRTSIMRQFALYLNNLYPFSYFPSKIN